MDATPECDCPLHERLAGRRQELRLSQSVAARLAGVKSRMTWWEWEKGRRHPYDYNYPGIETAMQWEPGSVQAILDGGAPTPLPAVETPAVNPARIAVRELADRFVAGLEIAPLAQYWSKRLDDPEQIWGLIDEARGIARKEMTEHGQSEREA